VIRAARWVETCRRRKAAGQRKVTRFLLGGGMGWPGGGAGCVRGGRVGSVVGGVALGGQPRRGGWAGSTWVSGGVWQGFNRRVEILSILSPILILKKRRLRSSTR
jgi:hypothetical protein